LSAVINSFGLFFAILSSASKNISEYNSFFSDNHFIGFKVSTTNLISSASSSSEDIPSKDEIPVPLASSTSSEDPAFRL
jgi:hypothetical protein